MRIFGRRLLLSGIFTSVSPYDEIPKMEDDRSGWDRLKNMLKFGPHGEMTPQSQILYENALFSFFVGFCIGGVSESRQAYTKFIEENMVTKFKHHLEAKRALQDAVTVGLAKGGVRLGSRTSLFCTSVLLIITSMNTYRGKQSVIDYTTAASVTFAIYKFKQGPKPAIAAAIIGAGIGTICGCFAILYMKLTKTTMIDVYNEEEVRLQKTRDEYKKYVEKKRIEKNLDLGREGEKLSEDINEEENSATVSSSVVAEDTDLSEARTTEAKGTSQS